MSESNLISVCQGGRGRGRRSAAKGPEHVLSDGTVPGHNCGRGYTTIPICQNAMNFTFPRDECYLL